MVARHGELRRGAIRFWDQGHRRLFAAKLADGVTTSEALTMLSKEYFVRQAGSLIPGDVAVDIETAY